MFLLKGKGEFTLMRDDLAESIFCFLALHYKWIIRDNTHPFQNVYPGTIHSQHAIFFKTKLLLI